MVLVHDAGSQLHPPAGPVGGVQCPGVRHVTQSSALSPWNRPSTSKKVYTPKIVPRVCILLLNIDAIELLSF